MAPEATECPAHKANGKDWTVTQREVDEVIDQTKLVGIPHPPHAHYFGLLGHLPQLDRVFPPRTYWGFMEKYGAIMQLDLGIWNYTGLALPRIFVGSHGLMNELMDDRRFKKFTNISPTGIRAILGDGLITAEMEEKNWGKARRVLVPAFGPTNLRKMFDDMVELSSQLVLKWDRFGPEQENDVTEDAKRLAIDTIGLCTFGYRFNEFYYREHHPFVIQMQQALIESGKRGARTPMLNVFYYRAEQGRQENIAKMAELTTKIVQDRIKHPNPDATDLLNSMLNEVDRETGEKLSIDNIGFQIPSFLSVGSETLSAALSLSYYYLCSNPGKLLKAQEEVDQVVGEGIITVDMLPKLTYLTACMKEAIRLQPPTAILNRTALRDTVMGGKYFVKKGQMVSALPRYVHRDPNVWGEDADEYRPERMLEGGAKRLPFNAWQPVSIALYPYLCFVSDVR